MGSVNKIDGLGIASQSKKKDGIQDDVQKQRIEAFDDQESFNLGTEPSLIKAQLESLLPEEQRAQWQSMTSGLDAEKTAVLETSSRQLAQALLVSSQSVEAADQDGNLLSAVSGAFESAVLQSESMDYAQACTHVMTMGVYGLESELLDFAAKVQNGNEMKVTIREEITMLRDILNHWPEGQSEIEVSYQSIEKMPDGSYQMVERTELLSKKDIEAKLDSMEQDLGTIADMTQMDMMDLQNKQQNLQRLIQMMSAIMKNQHDTLKAIINNLR